MSARIACDMSISIWHNLENKLRVIQIIIFIIYYNNKMRVNE